MFGPLLDVQISFRVAGARARDCAPCEEDLQRCGRRSTRDMFIRAVRRSGRWFPERGYILEHLQVCWDDFAWQVQHFLWPGIGRQLCAQLSIFEKSLAELFRFWCCQLRKMRKSGRIDLFWMLSSSVEEVSQNCFVFDVVKFKSWGNLAELFRFWRCQVQKLRKSRRTATCYMFDVVNFKIEEVSQNSFVFKLADRQIDRQLKLQVPLHYYYNYKCKYTTLHNTTLITLHYTNYI